MARGPRYGDGTLGVGPYNAASAQGMIAAANFVDGDGNLMPNTYRFLNSVFNTLLQVSGGPMITVAELPTDTANHLGVRAFVSDAVSPVSGQVVVGGGSTPVPVYCDGANWRVDAGTGASAPVGANPTATIGTTPVNGTATTYMRSDAAPTLPTNLTLIGPYVYLDNSTGAINGAGGAFLYGDAGAFALHLGGAGAYFLVQDVNGNNIGYIDSIGNLTITGATATKPGSTSWVNPSDRSLKQDIEPYQRGLEAILALNPVSFRYNGQHGLPEEEVHIGLIHDETGHMPEMHRTVRLGNMEHVEALDCSALTFALINAVKELAARVKELEAR